MKKVPSLLWSPNKDVLKKSKLYSFCKLLDKKNLLKFKKDFNYLWKWSVKKPDIFWSEVWDFTNIKGIKGKIILKKNNIFFSKIFFFLKKIKLCRKFIV